jgi:hypothetical protein
MSNAWGPGGSPRNIILSIALSNSIRASSSSRTWRLRPSRARVSKPRKATYYH